MTPGPTTKMDRSMLTGSGGGVGTTTGTEERKRCGETIHSGQFMVSHFETEGAEDDDDDLGMQMEEVKPTDLITTDSASVIRPVSVSGGLSDGASVVSGAGALVPMASIGSTEPQNQLARYVPKHGGSRSTVSQVEIDTDLSTVFNTLNVTYTQKLTSPKWNPFKGIRLRWKEKIRLNNVIWRCWHMQFIMKRKTLVCQFASPLDVDVHNTPQAILLEGKYWKRKCNVIKAEYKKWRRFNVNRALGATNIVDTTSELDFLEWSPISNDIFMITDNMPTDTLFSTLAQYPFPDSREIARGAGRADFIQPSLGPLQPNLDDLMDLDLDFLNFPRLAPVPEEASDDLLKAIEYNYTLGSNQLTNAGNSIQEAPETLGVSGNHQQTSQAHQATGCIQQQPPAALQYSAKLYAQSLQPPGGGSSASISSAASKFTRAYPKHNYDPKYPPTPHQTMAYNMVSQPHMGQTAGSNAVLGATASGGPYGSNASSGFQNVISSAATAPSGMLQMGSGGIPPSLTPSSMQLHYNHSNAATNPVNLSNSPAGTNIVGGAGGGGSSNVRAPTQMGTAPTAGQSNVAAGSVLLMQNLNSKLLTHSQSLPVPALPQTKQVPAQPRSTSMPTGPSNYNQMLAASQHSPPGSLHASQSGSSYKSYHGHQPQPYKIPSQTVGAGGSYASGVRAMRHSSPPHGTVLQPTSGSSGAALPINATFPLPPKEGDNFAMPRYHQQQQSSQKANAKLRTRSNSMIMKQQTTGVLNSIPGMGMVGSGSAAGGMAGSSQHMTPTLHATSSEPMLNVTNSALLAQLLTTNSNGMSLSQQSLSPESAHDTDGPLSPTGPGGSTSGGAGSKFPRSDSQRRTGHIHAEQKRRYNIKNGFDTLHSLIPQLQQNPNAKLSKAAMLQKGADYIKQLRSERSSATEQMDSLRREIEQLNNSLNNLHTALPASGAPVSRQRTGRVKELYHHYVRQRTLDNWKFWIFGLIFEPLLNSYNQTVSVASMDEMYRTSQLWVDQHCSLVELRPAVSNQLRQLSTTTDVLSDPPSSLQEEVLKAISNSSSNCLAPRGSGKGGSRGGSSTETSPHRS
uniref:BHLH domain-containing protein n=2 Tax=Anopheles gambiae TaxID=7165 RepID=A0A3F2YYX3_ANOGA